MSEEPTMAETPQEPLAPTPSPQETEEEEEEAVFSLKDLLRGKKGGKMEMGDVMSYAILTDIMDRREDRREQREWRREQREQQRTNPTSKSPEVESLRGEMKEVRNLVEGLAKTIQTQQETEAQKLFVQGVVKQTSDSIMPELQKVSARLEALEAQATTTPQSTAETAELKEIRDSLKSVTDKLGEKVGAKGLSLSDVTELIDVIETLEKRVVHKEGGEVDFKTMTVSTLGEIGKEMVTAYKEVATASKEARGYQPPQEETPASAMQTIIKRQVQNYILQRMETGATTMNVEQAAQELGLTSGQVAWAYNQLMKEGWFHVRTPQKGKKKKVSETVQEGEVEPESASEETDVFEPPAE